MLYHTFRTLSLEPEATLYVSGAEGGQILRVESSVLQVNRDVLNEDSRYIIVLVRVAMVVVKHHA